MSLVADNYTAIPGLGAARIGRRGRDITSESHSPYPRRSRGCVARSSSARSVRRKCRPARPWPSTASCRPAWLDPAWPIGLPARGRPACWPSCTSSGSRPSCSPVTMRGRPPPWPVAGSAAKSEQTLLPAEQGHGHRRSLDARHGSYTGMVGDQRQWRSALAAVEGQHRARRHIQAGPRPNQPISFSSPTISAGSPGSFGRAGRHAPASAGRTSPSHC